MPLCGLNIIERRSFMSESAIHRIGKYEILGKLGDGATSVVYLAKDEFNDRQVAIKLVSQTALKDQNRGQLMHSLFLTEAFAGGQAESSAYCRDL